MLSTMRKRVRAIMIIVAVTFILGFLLGELWRLIGQRGGRSGQSQQTYEFVGKVGNHNITQDEYRGALTYMTDKYKQDNQLRDLSNEDYAAVEKQTWQYLVTELTWAKALKDANIRVTQDEILEIMKSNPPEALRNNPELYTDGKFDPQKYEQAMNNPANRPYFTKYFQDLVDMLPKEKLRVDAMSAYRVTQGEAQDNTSAANTEWRMTALYFGPQLLTGQVDQSDAAVKAYYDKYRDSLFRIKETRQLRYVFFPVTMTAQDSQASADEIQHAYDQLKGGETFTLTMLDFSDLEADTTGTLYARARLDAKTDTVVSKLKPGTYSAPFLTNYGWQIVMLDSTRKDSIALRRILIRVKSSGEAQSAMRDSAHVFADKAQTENFDTLARAYGLSVASARPMVGGELNVSNLGIEGGDQLVDWMRHAKKWSTFDKPMRTPQGYFVFSLGDITPAGYQDFEKVKPAAAWRLKQETEKTVWMQKANDALGQIRAGKTLEQYAQENPAVELQVDTVKGLDDARRRKGPEYAGAMLAMAAGDKYGVLETNWGAFILRCDARSEIQPAPVTPQAWLQQRQQEVAQRYLETLLKEDNVKDYREGGY